jgi:hypothetical protein
MNNVTIKMKRDNEKPVLLNLEKMLSEAGVYKIVGRPGCRIIVQQPQIFRGDGKNNILYFASTENAANNGIIEPFSQESYLPSDRFIRTNEEYSIIVSFTE